MFAIGSSTRNASPTKRVSSECIRVIVVGSRKTFRFILHVASTLFIKRERRCGRMSCGHAPFMEDAIRTTLSCAISDAKGEINIILLGEGILPFQVNSAKRKINTFPHYFAIFCLHRMGMLDFDRNYIFPSVLNFFDAVRQSGFMIFIQKSATPSADAAGALYP